MAARDVVPLYGSRSVILTDRNTTWHATRHSLSCITVYFKTNTLWLRTFCFARFFLPFLKLECRRFISSQCFDFGMTSSRVDFIARLASVFVFNFCKLFTFFHGVALKSSELAERRSHTGWTQLTLARSTKFSIQTGSL